MNTIKLAYQTCIKTSNLMTIADLFINTSTGKFFGNLLLLSQLACINQRGSISLFFFTKYPNAESNMYGRCIMMITNSYLSVDCVFSLSNPYLDKPFGTQHYHLLVKNIADLRLYVCLHQSKYECLHYTEGYSESHCLRNTIS